MAASKAACCDMLLLTANVGSIFENPQHLLPAFVAELAQVDLQATGRQEEGVRG